MIPVRASALALSLFTLGLFAGSAAAGSSLPLEPAAPFAAGWAAGELQPGDVIVTEFMKDPSAVSDNAGEWIELANTLPWRVNLELLVVADAGNDWFALQNGGAGIWIGPYATFVLGNNADPTTNGGVQVDYEYSGFTLKNSNDEIFVRTRSGVLVDGVVYDDGVLWPDSPGASISLDPSAYDGTLNDDPANWCHATSTMPGGDRGTPGALNDVCQ